MPKYKGIYKRKNKKGGYTWYAYVDYNFKKYHVPGGYLSAEEARDVRADFEKKLYSGTNIDSNKITFHNFSTKIKKSQSTIPLLHDLILLLKEWRLQCKSLLWIFPSNRGTNPLDDNTWLKLHWIHIDMYFRTSLKVL